MKQFIDSVIASVFFLILMLLGETLQFLQMCIRDRVWAY